MEYLDVNNSFIICIFDGVFFNLICFDVFYKLMDAALRKIKDARLEISINYR